MPLRTDARVGTPLVAAIPIARGQLAPTVDADLLLDLVAGLMWQRVYIAHQPVSPADIEAVVALLLDAHRPA